MTFSTSEEFFNNRYAAEFNLPLDKDWSYREKKLHILYKFLDNSIYDYLFPFNAEYNGGKYTPLRQRRPSTIYSLCEIIVNDSTSMLFGDEHFPLVKCTEDHDETIQFLNKLTEDSDLKSKMLEAAYEGSIGSVCIIVKVVEGKFCYEILNTKTLTPFFDPKNPGNLIKLIDKKKVDGSTLKSIGYSINKEDLNKYFLVIREWTINDEIYYLPYLIDEMDDDVKLSVDKERSTTHDLGFLPGVWIRNLPSSKGIDGRCSFEKAIDISIEINYQLSQHGRLLKYNADPTMVIKNPASLEGEQLIKGIGTLNLDSDGDAYLLEMKGGVTKSVLEYVETLRKYALESVRGDRSSPEKMHSAQSGKALQFLNHPLITLVGDMRLTYGNNGLLKIYKLILKMCSSKKLDIMYEDNPIPQINNDCEDHIILDWPDWYPQTAQDDFNEAQTTNIYTQAKIISTKTALNSIADKYHIGDVDNELKEIEDQKSKDMEQQKTMMSFKNNQNQFNKDED